jgi:hypothetical protein
VWPAPKDELIRTLNATHPQTTYGQYEGWYGYEPVVEESAAFKKYKVNLAKRTAKTEPYCDNVYDAVYLYAQAIEACIAKEVSASGGTPSSAARALPGTIYRHHRAHQARAERRPQDVSEALPDAGGWDGEGHLHL